MHLRLGVGIEVASLVILLAASCSVTVDRTEPAPTGGKADGWNAGMPVVLVKSDGVTDFVQAHEVCTANGARLPTIAEVQAIGQTDPALFSLPIWAARDPDSLKRRIERVLPNVRERIENFHFRVASPGIPAKYRFLQQREAVLQGQLSDLEDFGLRGIWPRHQPVVLEGTIRSRDEFVDDVNPAVVCVGLDSTPVLNPGADIPDEDATVAFDLGVTPAGAPFVPVACSLDGFCLSARSRAGERFAAEVGRGGSTPRILYRVRDEERLEWETILTLEVVTPPTAAQRTVRVYPAHGYLASSENILFPAGVWRNVKSCYGAGFCLPDTPDTFDRALTGVYGIAAWHCTLLPRGAANAGSLCAPL